ncbi:MAG: hypothetical protein K6C36_07515 [Clostridia bacterium]|nr:hypothetical protein [Clostridia bacterium]
MKKCIAAFFAFLLAAALCAAGTPFRASAAARQSFGSRVLLFGSEDSFSSSGGEEGLEVDSDSGIPSSFDLRDVGGLALVTEVRDQGVTGCCWAFASLSSLESSAMMQGIMTSPDLSEYHLTWFASRSLVENEYDPTRGDGMSVADPFGYGGNAWMAADCLARGSGAAFEEDYPFDEHNPSNMTGISESDRYVAALGMSDLTQYDTASQAKRAIMTTGALYCTYYADTRYLSEDNSSYYCSTSLPSKRAGNHAVSVIGWDDGYSRLNFRFGKRPLHDGAWLVKNSWGNTRGEYGDGYLWISYYDTTLANFCSFTATDEQYLDRYQYDGAGFGGVTVTEGEPTAWESSVFTARRSSQLEAVTFISMNTNLYYTVDVFTDVPSGGMPFDGTLEAGATASGHFDCTGLHTVALSRPVPLGAGDRFAVVVTITDGDGDSICVTHEDDGASSLFAGSEETVSFYSEPGRSFMSYGSVWADMTSDLALGDLNIKALTKERTVPDSVKDYVAGDSDRSGDLTAADARLALRHAIGLEKLAAGAAWLSDADSSGLVEAQDARLILRAVLGLEEIDK